jgi:hypothetical protein
MKCKHIEKFNPIHEWMMEVTYKDGKTIPFYGYTCVFCPKCGERIRPDPTRDPKKDAKENREG